GYLKEHDADSRTVIALQIENEPGILGSDRDYGQAGEQAMAAPVPPEVLAGLQANSDGPLGRIWQDAGHRPPGSWPEMFGDSAGEVMTAWSIARYIDRLAEAGKGIYDIPMVLNVWLGETGWRVPGDNYPSGGAVSK